MPSPQENAGWFGDDAQVQHYLRTVNADRDEDGRFLIGGMVAVGYGGKELVVGGDAVYFVDGQPRGLASGLRGTSYGMAVVVI